jgi:hypothetical protein
VLDVCAVKAPGFGDLQKSFFEDICAFTGATLITPDLNMQLENATLADMGTLARVKVDKTKTILVTDGRHAEAVRRSPLVHTISTVSNNPVFRSLGMIFAMCSLRALRKGQVEGWCGEGCTCTRGRGLMTISTRPLPFLPLLSSPPQPSA